MKAQGSGNIIESFLTPPASYGFGSRHPTAAKWAVIGLTKIMAIELGPHACAATPSARRGAR
jgi:NAD(P)-dependent dehydrogenase (short-subunit alcohol dehydrogenase family)